MPGVKNRLQALKKQVRFVSCLQFRKKKFKMRSNLVFEPAAEHPARLGSIRPSGSKAEEICEKPAICCHQVAPRCPYSSSFSPQNQKVHLRNFLPSSYEFNGGGKSLQWRRRHHPKTTLGCLSCNAQKGTFAAFCTVS